VNRIDRLVNDLKQIIDDSDLHYEVKEHNANAANANNTLVHCTLSDQWNVRIDTNTKKAM
jgi:hypothetical protein